jgi:hypothetical protein
MSGRGRPARQRGWAGVLAMLIVVGIVALLAGVLLRQNGLAGAPAPRAPALSPAAGTVGGVAPPDAEVVVPAPMDALGRARGLEDSVRQQAADIDQRIDAGTK